MAYWELLTKRRQILYHCIGWAVFIVYEITLVKFVRGASGIHDPVLTAYVIPYVINISFFYFHAFVVMPFCTDKKPGRLVLFGLLLLTELVVYLLLMGMKDLSFLNKETDFLSSLYSSEVDFIRQLWRGIYFLIFSTAFWLIHRSFKKEQLLKEAETSALMRQQEKKELELRLISSQNAFLQSQISPHLLFNTLNFIHSEVQQVSDKASDAIITLSDMMRYSLSESKSDGKVELERELEQIENLIKINQTRFDKKLCIEFVTEGDFSNSRIIPLLLVPFVENLFKYADLTDEKAPVRIGARIKANLLLFETFNKKRRTISFPSPGIGIQNVTTRLSSYYPDRFSLAIDEAQSTFSVSLEVEL
ncbi:MAG: sensor histidine kinase [Chitinophagaceae bacterium]